MVQAGDRTRLVLNLKEGTTYRAELQGKSVLISLGALAILAVRQSTRDRDAVERWSPSA